LRTIVDEGGRIDCWCLASINKEVCI
jgi:hypothetical protein